MGREGGRVSGERKGEWGERVSGEDTFKVSSAPSIVPHFRSGGGVSLHCQSRATLRLDLVGIATQSDGNASSPKKWNES